MKTFQYLTLSCLCLFLCTQAFAQAEEDLKVDQKSQTTIIIKTIDENGNEKTQTITKDGEAMDIDIDGDKIDLKDLDIYIKQAKPHLKQDGKISVWSYGNHHSNKHAWFSQKNCDKAFLGIVMTKEIHNDNGVETITGESAEGVLISDIIKDTGAADAGLLANDILTAIDGKAMKTMNAVIQEIRSHEVNDQIMVEYLRDGQTAQVQATLKGKKCDDTKTVIIDEESLFVPNNIDIDIEIDGDIEVESITDKIMEIKKKKDAERAKQNAAAITPVEKETLINTSPQNKQALDLQEIDIYPNPSNGWVNLNFTGLATATSISIIDVSGREIYREELPLFNGNYQKEIDIRNAPKGTLFVNIKQGEKIHTEKIIFN